MTFYQSTLDGSVMDLDYDATAYGGFKRLTRAEGQRLRRKQASDELRKILKPGDTVHCILRHCSRSGMRRHISLLADGMRDITGEVAHALDEKRADDGGIKVDGCGMDMGFHLVYNLGRVLWPEGFGLPTTDARTCAKDKAQAEAMKASGVQFDRGRNGDTSGWDNDGGYALKHRWV